MSGAVIMILIGLGLLLLMLRVGGAARAENRRYYREVAAWANERGWAYREDSPFWKSMSSPGAYREGLHVHGTHSDHAFTLEYTLAIPREGLGYSLIRIETTEVVVHLPSAYPATQIKRRGFRRTAGIGYAEFDREFQVRTDAPGGPSAVVSTQLAKAHLAGNVPLWTLRDKELTCYEYGKTKVEDLDATVDQAVRVAELLGSAPR